MAAIRLWRGGGERQHNGPSAGAVNKCIPSVLFFFFLFSHTVEGERGGKGVIVLNSSRRRCETPSYLRLLGSEIDSRVIFHIC